MSDERWNTPPDELSAVRKGDGWTFNLPAEPSFGLGVILMTAILVPGLGGLWWLEGLYPDAGTLPKACVLITALGFMLLFSAMLTVLYGILFGTSIELQPHGVRFAGTWIPAEDLPQAVLDEDVDEVKNTESGTPLTSRVPVIVLGDRRMRLQVDTETAAWVVSAIQMVRERADRAPPEAREEMHKALGSVVQRATENQDS